MPNQKAFALIPVIVILVVLGIAGSGIYFYSTKKADVSPASPTPSPTEMPSPTPSPTPTPTPTIPPTPTPTIKPTPRPTVKPTPTTKPQVECPSSGDKGNITVNVQSLDGTLVGDTTVVMSNGNGDCAATDSKLPLTQTIPNGGKSVNFADFSVGKYHFKVTNNGRTIDYEYTVQPGHNPINFNF